MSNFDDENEKVRNTLGRVMTDMGYFNNPVTINTPVGSRTFYERDDSPLMTKTRQAQPTSSQYYIRDDKNYAWDMPQKYDRRPNIAGTWNNFVKINREDPPNKALTTGNIVGDYHLVQSIGKISPYAKAAVLGANTGSLLGGYAYNLKKAYDESHLFNEEK